MLFFRSEDALDEWLTSSHAKRGHVFRIPHLWEFTRRWYRDRMSPDYHGRSLEQVQAIFREFGLTSNFWQAGSL